MKSILKRSTIFDTERRPYRALLVGPTETESDKESTLKIYPLDDDGWLDDEINFRVADIKEALGEA